MIPVFPNFKKIELRDRADINQFTYGQKPYSDFNFTNLWAWDTNDERMVSILNDNLIVRFSDYVTGKPFFSFLGTEKPEATAMELIEYSKEIGIPTTLRFIAEESILLMKSAKFRAQVDTENFDYIFSVPELAALTGGKYKNRRRLAGKFIEDNPEAFFVQKELSDHVVQEQLLGLLASWSKRKKTANSLYDEAYETIAFKRLLDTSKNHKLVLSCIYLHGTLLGFSIDELLPEKYALSHFLKANIEYRGIYEYINEQVAQYLLRAQIELWNWEQDLNIEGLRQLKMSYRPVDFLKKYKISIS